MIIKYKKGAHVIHNRTNFIIFLLCILLPTVSYGMRPTTLPKKSITQQDIKPLYLEAVKKGYYDDTDSINDLLITLLPTNANQETQNEITKQIQTFYDENTENKFNVSELASNILEAKQQMATTAENNDDQWTQEETPNNDWNQAIANKAITLNKEFNINTAGMLKIINEIIEQKGTSKSGEPFDRQQLIVNAKKNIEKIINEKIEIIKKETEEKKAQKEQEIIEKERLEAEEQKRIAQKKEEKLKEARAAKVIEPEKEILEKPLEEKPEKVEKKQEEQAPVEQKQKNEAVQTTAVQTVQNLEPEKKKEEPTRTEEEKQEQLAWLLEEQPTAKEPVKTPIEETIDMLIIQHKKNIEAAYKKDKASAVTKAISPVVTGAAEQFPDEPILVQNILIKKLEKYGTDIENQESNTAFIINRLMKSFIKKVTAEEITTKKLETAVKNEEQIQKLAIEETKNIQKYLNHIVSEIESNKQNGIGTVIVHRNATDLITYINNLAKENEIEKIVPDKWYIIYFGNEIFSFKQLSDGTIEYLKAPNEDTSTIIANPNWTYVGDDTIVPQIADSIKTETNSPQTALSTLQKRINKAELPELVVSAPEEQPAEQTLPTPAIDYAAKANTVANQDYSNLVNARGVKAPNLSEQLRQRLTQINTDPDLDQATKISEAKEAIDNAYTLLDTYHIATPQELTQQPVPQYPAPSPTIEQQLPYPMPTEQNLPYWYYPTETPFPAQQPWPTWMQPQQPAIQTGPREFPSVQPTQPAPQPVTKKITTGRTSARKATRNISSTPNRAGVRKPTQARTPAARKPAPRKTTSTTARRTPAARRRATRRAAARKTSQNPIEQ